MLQLLMPVVKLESPRSDLLRYLRTVPGCAMGMLNAVMGRLVALWVTLGVFIEQDPNYHSDPPTPDAHCSLRVFHLKH